jgi:hypothetical protein
MDVPFTVKLMALAWTSGELLCLAVLRWLLFEFMGGSPRRQTPFFAFCAISFMFLVWTVHGGADVAYRWLEGHGGLGWYSSHMLWRLFVTVWVVVEGVCLIYGVRLYKLVGSRLAGRGHGDGTAPLWCRGWLTATFVLFTFTLYIVYFRSAINMFQTYGLSASQMLNISSFYLRLCGFLFIIIEWLIAVLMWRAYGLVNEYYERAGDS